MAGERESPGARRTAEINRWQQFKDKFKGGGLSVSMILMIVVHIAMIVIGAMNIHKCPVEKNIPIFLIVYGAVGLVSKFVALFRNMLIRYIKLSTILSIITTVELIFFILGSYWVFKENKPNYDPASGNLYCNKTTFVFALVIICLIYVVYGILFLFLLCFLCGICAVEKCVSAEEAKELNTESANP